MSDDWKAGDLALCVRGGPWFATSMSQDGFPKKGAIYRVDKKAAYRFRVGTRPALWLADGPRNISGERVWDQSRFRKIRPHTPDAEDAETIALMNGAGVKEASDA